MIWSPKTLYIDIIKTKLLHPIDSGGSDGYVALAAEFEVEVMPKSKIWSYAKISAKPASSHQELAIPIDCEIPNAPNLVLFFGSSFVSAHFPTSVAGCIFSSVARSEHPNDICLMHDPAN